MTTRLRSLKRSDRRALLVGALLCGSVLLVGRGLPWVQRTGAAFATRAERAALTIERAARVREEATVDGWTGANTGPTRADLAFEGSTPTAAAAAASAHLGDLIRLLGGTLLSSSPEADTAFHAGVARVAVHLQLSIDGIAFRSLVAQLEGGPKLLRVRSLNVVQPAPIAAASEPEALRVEVTVEGIGVVQEAKR